MIKVKKFFPIISAGCLAQLGKGPGLDKHGINMKIGKVRVGEKNEGDGERSSGIL